MLKLWGNLAVVIRRMGERYLVDKLREFRVSK